MNVYQWCAIYWGAITSVTLVTRFSLAKYAHNNFTSIMEFGKVKVGEIVAILLISWLLVPICFFWLSFGTAAGALAYGIPINRFTRRGKYKIKTTVDETTFVAEEIYHNEILAKIDRDKLRESNPGLNFNIYDQKNEIYEFPEL